MIRSVLLWLTSAFLVVTTFWNIWIFDKRFAEMPPSSDEVVAQEIRYTDLRLRLLAAGYRGGYVGFITNRDVRSEPNTFEENKRWVQAQFVLLPWIVLHDSHTVPGPPVKAATPFVIGDFWDGFPQNVPPGLIKLHESDDGLTLFKRKSSE